MFKGFLSVFFILSLVSCANDFYLQPMDEKTGYYPASVSESEVVVSKNRKTPRKKYKYIILKTSQPSVLDSYLYRALNGKSCFKLIKSTLPEKKTKALLLKYYLSRVGNYNYVFLIRIEDIESKELYFRVKLEATNWVGLEESLLNPVINKTLQWFRGNECNQ
ncbi:hypothetical protein MNBD_GAMMA10-3221 [hydrothermal vent metagenome]|uniref:Lipoprotein n=1 Tax=hydrothermal vent metagenome TaxID=652676 RepID=A0A3B0XT88_9ZZZZ